MKDGEKRRNRGTCRESWACHVPDTSINGHVTDWRGDLTFTVLPSGTRQNKCRYRDHGFCHGSYTTRGGFIKILLLNLLRPFIRIKFTTVHRLYRCCTLTPLSPGSILGDLYSNLPTSHWFIISHDMRTDSQTRCKTPVAPRSLRTFLPVPCTSRRINFLFSRTVRHLFRLFSKSVFPDNPMKASVDKEVEILRLLLC